MPEMHERERVAALVQGLIGWDHRRLYDTNALFRTNIDTLARLLVVWADAIAADAGKNEPEIRARMRMLMETPWTPSGPR